MQAAGQGRHLLGSLGGFGCRRSTLFDHLGDLLGIACDLLGCHALFGQDVDDGARRLRRVVATCLDGRHCLDGRGGQLRTALAALGRLVAGVAHELNTPIGNALMAVSTLRESSSGFQREIERGLRKSVLEAFVRDLATGLDISERNMHKAGELIASFKQVAVDQTSLQRRRFEVQEIVSETLMTLHPTLKRMPYEVLADVEPGLSMDSYPGPLGQVLANLINNAVTHAFDGRDHGVVRILARAQGEDRVSIRVADDGVGIPEAERKRVFDPFYTTRLGRGGTGLGLHIVHANVTRVLGGAVRLLDEEAGGSVFELDLPRVAP